MIEINISTVEGPALILASSKEELQALRECTVGGRAADDFVAQLVSDHEIEWQTWDMSLKEFRVPTSEEIAECVASTGATVCETESENKEVCVWIAACDFIENAM